jgi:hypothetical protein
MLPRCLAGSSFRDPEATLQVHDRPAPPLRGQKFPRDTSLSRSMSRACSPTIRFSLGVLLLQLLQPHHILGAHRLVLRPPPLIGLHRDLQVPADRVHVAALGQQPIRLPQFPHDLLRAVPTTFHESHLLRPQGDRDSHNGWTRSRGSPHSHGSLSRRTTPRRPEAAGGAVAAADPVSASPSNATGGRGGGALGSRLGRWLGRWWGVGYRLGRWPALAGGRRASGGVANRHWRRGSRSRVNVL